MTAACGRGTRHDRFGRPIRVECVDRRMLAPQQCYPAARLPRGRRIIYTDRRRKVLTVLTAPIAADFFPPGCAQSQTAPPSDWRNALRLILPDVVRWYHVLGELPGGIHERQYERSEERRV